MKKVISVLLVLVLLSTIVPFNVIAASVEDKVAETEAVNTSVETGETEAEYIYYSDLFYAYSNYLESAPYLTSYYIDTQGALNKVYNEYMDSPMFKWSNIKNSLAMAFDLKEWTKMVADSFGLTSFTYNNALDAANVDFASQLIGSSETAKVYGTEAKWVGKINDILKVYDTFDKNYDVSRMTEEEVFTAMFATIEDTGVVSYISSSKLTELETDILPHISSITSKLSTGKDVLTAAKVIATGIMMEDFRMELIDDILKNTPSGTMLYDGISRLKQQLSNGFVSYFLENYLKDEILNELADKVVKNVTSALLQNQAGLYAVIGALTKVGSWIVFDCIFHVPDIDDLTKQMVLSEYSVNLYDILVSKLDKLSSGFDSADILSIEATATAYDAATKAALKASDKIKLDSNKKLLSDIVSKYGSDNFYSEWISSAKALILIIPKESRNITDFGTWVLKSLNYTLVEASDSVESGYIYCPDFGLKADIRIVGDNSYIWYGQSTKYQQLTIPEGTDVIIDGNIIVGGYNAKLTVHGKLRVTGSMLHAEGDKYVDKQYVTNNGYLEIEGDIDFSGTNEPEIHQTEENAVLKVGGNFSTTYPDVQ